MMLRRHWPLLVVCLGMTVHICVTLVYALTLHYEFKTSAYDIGDFTQLLYNIIHGNGMVVTIAPPHVEQHWFTVHFSPILYLLVPLYALFPHEETLRAVNVVLLAAAALPLFFAVLRLSRHEGFAAVFALAYLVNPCVTNAAVWDFHEVSFAPLLFAFGYLAVLQKNRGWFIIVCLLLLAVKEHYGLAVFGFGMLWALHHREWRFGAIIGVGGLLVLAIVVGMVMPWLSPSGRHFMTENSNRYGWIFEMRGVDLNLFVVMLAVSGIIHVFLLVLGFIFLPFAALMWLLPGLADMAVNLGSGYEMMRSPYSYHSVPVVLVCCVAAAAGGLRLMRKNPRLLHRDIILAVAISMIGLQVALSVLPYRADNFWELSAPKLSPDATDVKAMREIRNMIPKTDAIAFQANVGAHFGDWPQAYYFPFMLEPASWLLLRLDFPYRLRKEVFSSPFEVSCPNYLRSVNELLEDPEWGVTYWNSPWLVLRRGASDIVPVSSEIKETLLAVRTACEKVGYTFEPSKG